MTSPFAYTRSTEGSASTVTRSEVTRNSRLSALTRRLARVTKIFKRPWTPARPASPTRDQVDQYLAAGSRQKRKI